MEENRPVRDLKGLFRFCTDMTAKEDAPRVSNVVPMDKERKEWLQTVMAEISGGSAKQLRARIQTLVEAVAVEDKMVSAEGDDKKVEDAEYALEDLLEIVHDVDQASDMLTLGGFPVLLRLLSSRHCKLQGLAGAVLGAACQNNPRCQDAAVAAALLATLLPMVIATDVALFVRAKALYAVSCIVRCHTAATAQFTEFGGYAAVVASVSAADERLFIKAAFLATHLMTEQQDAAATLVSLGYAEILASCLCSNRMVTTETREANSTPTKANASETPARNIPSNLTTQQTNGSTATEVETAITMKETEAAKATSPESTKIEAIERTTEATDATTPLLSNACREHCSSALLALCSMCPEAERRCKADERLKPVLERRLAKIRDNEEFQEEVDYVTELLQLLWGPVRSTTSGHADVKPTVAMSVCG